MRRTGGLVLIAGLCASAALAQNGGTHVGIGVPLNPASIIDPGDGLYLPVGLGNLTVPIVLGGLRVEPEVGLLRVSSSSSSSGSTYKSTTTSLRVGVAVHKFFGASGGFRACAGPRVGIVRLTESASFSSTEAKSRTQHWYAGAVLGGEFAFSPHFALGAEAHVIRIHLGEEEQISPPSPGPAVDYSNSLITTNGIIMARFYP